jgi:hypothetical protein
VLVCDDAQKTLKNKLNYEISNTFARTSYIGDSLSTGVGIPENYCVY